MSGSSACSICGKVFQGINHKFLLRRHILTHTGERRYACPYCSYHANQAGNLNRHIRSRHSHEGISQATSKSIQQVAVSGIMNPISTTHQGIILSSRPSLQQLSLTNKSSSLLPVTLGQTSAISKPSDLPPRRSPPPLHHKTPRPTLHHTFPHIPLNLQAPVSPTPPATTSSSSHSNTTTTTTPQ
ncbi:hypothetical protein Pcinc_014517 [Petrolisthes cinctipes]|uniref:C2H2-type domain-containing protein n=1 Tax=Petrolisthes cinctipes TaxID=88211 RepID=A0AAE1FWS9_PETCI|nr:hypothetical protein Pcinc_014517 [Petrolisthes cinctipes]